MANRTLISGACLTLSLFFFFPTHNGMALAFIDEAFELAFQDHNDFGHIPSDDSVLVKRLSFPIQLGDKTGQQMAGFLYFDSQGFSVCKRHKSLFYLLKCIQTQSLKNRTLQVLIHGFTYNHTYWDPPHRRLSRFSYARFMARQGYPVLALDLLGTGGSSIPDGDVLNITESVSSLAQVLIAARALSNPLGGQFDKIVLIGHSVGTATAVLTTGTFPGIVDFLIATGWSFSPHVVPLSSELVAASLANPYIRFPDSVREELFYFTPSARQPVINFDNRFLADQFSRGVLIEGLPLLEAMALGDFQAIRDLTRIDKVNVPVLVQLGRFDVIAPPLLPDIEAQLYSNSPDVHVEILERIGHSFNLHTNRLTSWAGINKWIEERLVKKRAKHNGEVAH
ncbi:MAG: alpha/beta hydrolase [Nitrospirales bacterium]|nr:alpha/beta hydrolase [Nitrospirales bacterium]